MMWLNSALNDQFYVRIQQLLRNINVSNIIFSVVKAETPRIADQHARLVELHQVPL